MPSVPDRASNRRIVVLSLGIGVLTLGATSLAHVLLDPDRPDGWIRRRLDRLRGADPLQEALRAFAYVAAGAGMPLRVPTRLRETPDGGWIQEGTTTIDPHRARGVTFTARSIRLRPQGAALRLRLDGVAVGFGAEATGRIGGGPGGAVSIASVEATPDAEAMLDAVLQDVQIASAGGVMRLPLLRAGRLDGAGLWTIDAAPGERIGTSGRSSLPGGASPGGRWEEIGRALFG